MKFFEAVPDELFSPLASPNRALYADALDVLCEKCIRLCGGKLKPEFDFQK